VSQSARPTTAPKRLSRPRLSSCLLRVFLSARAPYASCRSLRLVLVACSRVRALGGNRQLSGLTEPVSMNSRWFAMTRAKES
jgi:hypothetical protein